MGICSNGEEIKRKQILEEEIRIKNSKQKIKMLITKYEANIKFLIVEIKDLDLKVKTDDGKTTSQEKQEFKNDLYEKIKKCLKLYAYRRLLKANLSNVEDIERDKEMDGILDGINDFIESYPLIDEIIDKNVDLNRKREIDSENKLAKLERNLNTLDGSQSEKNQVINNFMNSLNIK